MAISDAHAATALLKISNIQNGRSNHLLSFMAGKELISSYEKKEAQYPFYETFPHTGGPDGILKFSNFSPSKVAKMLEKCLDFLDASWSVCRGKKSNSLFLISFS